MKVELSILATTVCALLVAIPLNAANGPAAKTSKTATTAPAVWRLPPETVSGQITMVTPDQKLVVVETAGGVPFDVIVTPKTRIKSGDQVVTPKDLTQDMKKTVSVKFIPERRGDVAETIRITG